MTRKKQKNLKYQFLSAVEKNFSEKIDKHSYKKTNKNKNNIKVFSYAERKNLIDLSANFANFMKENYKEIKLVKEIKDEHTQAFLNKKAENCSQATLKNYVARLKKLEKQINDMYKTNAKFTDVAVPVSEANTKKIRDVAMTEEDFKKLEATYDDKFDTGLVAINLSKRAGLRVSEVAKLKGTDIDLKNKCINVIDAKGKRSRKVEIDKEDFLYFEELKGHFKDARCCAVQSESINRNINRHMQKVDLKTEYEKTSIHAIRKMYAQRKFDEYRENESISDSWGKVSELLGHSKDRKKLMQTYITNIH